MSIRWRVSEREHPQKCHFLYFLERPLQQFCTTVQTVICDFPDSGAMNIEVCHTGMQMKQDVVWFVKKCALLSSKSTTPHTQSLSVMWILLCWNHFWKPPLCSFQQTLYLRRTDRYLRKSMKWRLLYNILDERMFALCRLIINYLSVHCSTPSIPSRTVLIIFRS